jgi:hypothetical protein
MSSSSRTLRATRARVIGGRRRRLAVLAVTAPVTAMLVAAAVSPARAASAAPPRPAPRGGPVTVHFGFTGGIQHLTLPDGVASISVTARGGDGGHGANANLHSGGAGGSGDVAHADSVPVSATLSQLDIYVGGNGESGRTFRAGDGGWNGGGSGASAEGGGGGGGASDVRPVGGDLTTRLIVASGGGGGGAGGSEGVGGTGGGSSGGRNGADGQSDPIDPFTCHGRGGGAGNLQGGGRGGDSPCAGDGIGGARQDGGRGGSSAGFEGGGGGGAGYFGGGGGGGGFGGSGAGGAAGSTFFAPGATGTRVSADGSAPFVDITYTAVPPQVNCNPHLTLAIGDQIGGGGMVICTAAAQGTQLRLTGDGPPAGCVMRVLDGSVDYVALATNPAVQGPPRDYHYTVTATRDGAESVTHFTITVAAAAGLGVTGGLIPPPPLTAGGGLIPPPPLTAAGGLGNPPAQGQGR